MSDEHLINVGDFIFSNIDDNQYLNELYSDILYNYSLRKFKMDNKPLREVDIVAALRFADLLSKSTHKEKRDAHKMWAQEIIILLDFIYPNNSDVKYYAGSVFSNTTNYQARTIIKDTYTETSAYEKAFMAFQDKYLTIPASPTMRFLGNQKIVYDHLEDKQFSYRENSK